jgi:hypothetical protein
MDKLKLFSRKAYILLAALVLSIFETALIAVGIILAGALAMIIIPVLSWIGNGILAKAKLKMVR